MNITKMMASGSGGWKRFHREFTFPNPATTVTVPNVFGCVPIEHIRKGAMGLCWSIPIAVMDVVPVCGPVLTALLNIMPGKTRWTNVIYAYLVCSKACGLPV